MTVIINRLEIDTVKFEDLTGAAPYSYLPPRGSVLVDTPRVVNEGFNINGQKYYVFAERMSIKIMTIKSPAGYGIPGSMASALIQLWDKDDILAAPFVIIENYSTFDGTTKTWNKCIILEEPIFTPLNGEELRYFYNYSLTIGLLP